MQLLPIQGFVKRNRATPCHINTYHFVYNNSCCTAGGLTGYSDYWETLIEKAVFPSRFFIILKLVGPWPVHPWILSFCHDTCFSVVLSCICSIFAKIEGPDMLCPSAPSASPSSVVGFLRVNVVVCFFCCIFFRGWVFVTSFLIFHPFTWGRWWFCCGSDFVSSSVVCVAVRNLGGGVRGSSKDPSSSSGGGGCGSASSMRLAAGAIGIGGAAGCAILLLLLFLWLCRRLEHVLLVVQVALWRQEKTVENINKKWNNKTKLHREMMGSVQTILSPQSYLNNQKHVLQPTA